jgi:hypothetical protein
MVLDRRSFDPQFASDLLVRQPAVDQMCNLHFASR